MTNNIVIRCAHLMLHALRRRHGGGGTISDGNKQNNDDEDHGLDIRYLQMRNCFMLLILHIRNFV